MALQSSYESLLASIDDYGDLAKKQNRKEGVLRGIEMLNDAISAAKERKRRKQEREQDIALRTKERLEDKTADLEQKMVDRQSAEIEDNVKAARERKKKREEEAELEQKVAPHLGTVQQVRELLAQAESSIDDPVARHQYLSKATHLTYDLPKEVTMKYPWLDNVAQDKRALEAEISAEKKAARDAAKNDATKNPEWIALTTRIKGKLDEVITSNPEMELPALLLQAEMFSKQPNPDRVLEMYNGIIEGIKTGEGGNPPSSLSGKPLTKQMADEASGLSYEPELTEEAEQGAALFGGRGELINTPDSLYTPTRPLDQYEYMIQQETENLIEAGEFPDTPRGRAFARTKATGKVDKQFPGKAPKKGKYQPDMSAAELIARGEDNLKEAISVNIAKMESEVKTKYPNYIEAMEGDPNKPGSMEAADRFRKLIDSTYFPGAADWLMHGALSPDALEPEGQYPRE